MSAQSVSARSVNAPRASRETCGPRQRTAQTQFSVENDKVRRFAGPPTGTTCKSQLRGSGSTAGREVIPLCNRVGAAVQRKVLMETISRFSSPLSDVCIAASSRRPALSGRPPAFSRGRRSRGPRDLAWSAAGSGRKRCIATYLQTISQQNLNLAASSKRLH